MSYRFLRLPFASALSASLAITTLFFENPCFATNGYLPMVRFHSFQNEHAVRTECSLIPPANSFKSLNTLISEQSLQILSAVKHRDTRPSLLKKEFTTLPSESLPPKSPSLKSCTDTTPVITIQAYYPENDLADSSEVIGRVLVPAIEKLYKRSISSSDRQSILKSLELLVKLIENSKAEWRQTASTAHHSIQKPAIKSQLLGRVNVWTSPEGMILVEMPDLHVDKGASKSVHLAFDYEKILSNDPHPLLAMGVTDITSKTPHEIKLLEQEYEIQHSLAAKGISVVPPRWMTKITKRGAPAHLPAVPKSFFMIASDYYEEGTLSGFAKHFNGLSPIESLRSSKDFNVDRAREQTSIELLKQLKSIHDENIYHGDIKPANILVRKIKSNSLEVALADFGAASKINEIESSLKKDSFDLANHFQGTVPSMAPETMHVDEDHPSNFKDPQLVKKGDVWALGLTFYFMKHKQEHPGCYSDDLNEFALMVQIAQIKTYNDLCTQCGIFCDPTKSKTVAPPAGTYDEVVYKMLHPDPFQRISAEAALKMLSR